MYSGLLPPGVNESDVELSSDDDVDVDADAVGSVLNCVNKEEKPHERVRETALSYCITENELNADALPSQSDKEHDSQKLTYSRTYDCPPGISPHLCHKFQELQKKKEEMKTEKDYGKRRRKRKRRRLEGSPMLQKAASEQEEKTESELTKRENHWNELKQYFGVNDRFEPPACSRPPKKTSLEESIDKAVAEGDLKKAEELSDRLATRDLAVKIAKAVDCRDFIKAKEAEASEKAKKQEKQLAWGFEAKKRWETKSNMGYM